MKVGFYINNCKYQNVDCRYVEEGNPGIGGTWHIFLIIASQLARRNNGIEITLYVQTHSEYLPDGPKISVVGSTMNAFYQADKDNLDYLVVNDTDVNWNNIDYNCLKSSVHFISWCHNFIPEQSRKLNIFRDEVRISRVINVSHEQMDLYLDHLAYDKMDYIYNCVPVDRSVSNPGSLIPYNERSHIVTYVGSLIPQKCFHVLASIWPKILAKVPDAELYVIGSGRTYDEKAKLGKYGIAESSYESKFMPYLTNADGTILNGVHFMGNLGLEKNDILAKTKVGVPNPTGMTETFCISAVEMQAMGCTVTAMAAPGYYDTFINGRIVSNKKKLTASIIDLLLSDTPLTSYEHTLDIIENKFSIDTVVSEWEKCLSGVYKELYNENFEIVNKDYHLKRLKLLLRKIKLKCSYFNKMMNVEYFIYQYERIRRHVRGY